MINPNTGEALIEFPCEFLLKITGKNEEDFEARIITLLKTIDPDLDTHKIKKNYSKTGKYISLSVLLYVTEQSHVDQAYALLKSDASVLWGL